MTARAPHRPCLISFVPGVSSAFFPMTARQPWCGSAWLGSSRVVSSRVVSALCRTEIAQMETSVSFSLRSPVTLLAFSLRLSFTRSPLPRSLLYSVLSPFISVTFLAHLKVRVLDSYFTSLLMRLRVKFATSLQIYMPNVRLEYRVASRAAKDKNRVHKEKQSGEANRVRRLMYRINQTVRA